MKKSVYSLDRRKLLLQFTKFCSVGVVGVTFNYSIFFVLYYFFSVYYIVSSGTGFILAMFLAFYLNVKYTFVDNKENIPKKIIGYFGVSVFSLFLGLFILKILVEILLINVYLSNFLIIGVTTLSNFSGNKFLVFKERL